MAKGSRGLARQKRQVIFPSTLRGISVMSEVL
jgi:hypothetical protein